MNRSKTKVIYRGQTVADRTGTVWDLIERPAIMGSKSVAMRTTCATESAMCPNEVAIRNFSFASIRSVIVRRRIKRSSMVCLNFFSFCFFNKREFLIKMEFSLKECNSRAQLFYDLVDNFGCNPYLESQESACVCSDKKNKKFNY